jgi:spermidine synthase
MWANRSIPSVVNALDTAHQGRSLVFVDLRKDQSHARRPLHRGTDGDVVVENHATTHAYGLPIGPVGRNHGQMSALNARKDPRPAHTTSLRSDRSGRARWWLATLVLVAGAASLSTEMTGARLLAPYFGASDLVWSNVIGLILVSLAVGYWLGGKVADRYPTHRALATVVLVAALALAVIPFAARPLFLASANAFANVSAGAFIASFFGALAMFIIPVTALGAVAPWSIRLSVETVGRSGSVAGRLYALSTVGAIIGTFLPVLVLIPLIGTRRTLLCTAALLAVTAIPALDRRLVWVPLALIGLIALPLGAIKPAGPGERILFEGESTYQFVQVVQQSNGDRVLHLNEGWAAHSLLPARGILTDNYWDAFTALPALAGGAHGRALVLGNAGGTVATLYGHIWPNVTIDGVEIDPLVTTAGRHYLDMANPRLHVYTADARFWLEGSRPRYDVIVVDAYAQPYIPFYLATREFFALVARHLTPGGVVAVNVGTPPDQTALVGRIATTMHAVFPTVMTDRFTRFNSIVLGFGDPTAPGAAQRALTHAPGLAGGPARQLAAGLVAVPAGGTPLTDDRSPIELLTDQALLAYLSEGAPGAH